MTDVRVDDLGPNDELANLADQSCEACGGIGRISGGVLEARVTSCPCTHATAPFFAPGFRTPHLVIALERARTEGRISDWTPGPLGTYHLLPLTADTWWELTPDQAWAFATATNLAASDMARMAGRVMAHVVNISPAVADAVHQLAHRSTLPLTARELAHEPFARTCDRPVEDGR